MDYQGMKAARDAWDQDERNRAICVCVDDDWQRAANMLKVHRADLLATILAQPRLTRGQAEQLRGLDLLSPAATAKLVTDYVDLLDTLAGLRPEL